MKRTRNIETGVALALVLLLALGVEGWLGASLLHNQAAGSGGQRVAAQVSSASNVTTAANSSLQR